MISFLVFSINLINYLLYSIRFLFVFAAMYPTEVVIDSGEVIR